MTENPYTSITWPYCPHILHCIPAMWWEINMSPNRTWDCKQRFILSFSSGDAEIQRSLKHSLKIIAWITRSYACATLAVSQTLESCLPRQHFEHQLTRNALIIPKMRSVVFETQPLRRKCSKEMWNIFFLIQWIANQWEKIRVNSCRLLKMGPSCSCHNALIPP